MQKTKAERIAEMKTVMAQIEEGVPALIISSLSEEFDIPRDEVEEIYWQPWKDAVKQSQSRRMEGVSCHYCGGPAIDFDFFDTPVCSQCGGS